MVDVSIVPLAVIKIDYVEFFVTDVQKAKQFYTQAFGWTFVDYGDDYASFSLGNINGGFAKVDAIKVGGPLIVLFARDLPDMQQRIIQAGGKIVRETFAFPGGSRFHFSDISGNELAVWSDQ